jgi:hypothetical protein
MKKVIKAWAKKEVEVELAEFYKSTIVNWHFAIKEDHILQVLDGEEYAVITKYIDLQKWADNYLGECNKSTEQEFNDALKSAMTKLNIL